MRGRLENGKSDWYTGRREMGARVGKEEEEEGSLWDFPTAQTEQKSIELLLDVGILQCCKTNCSTW